MNFDNIPIPRVQYPLNWDNVYKYIVKVSKNVQQKDALAELFKATKYISFGVLITNLKAVVKKFNETLIGDYAACLFTIDFESIEYKSNYWIYKLLLKLGLNIPTAEIFNEDDVDKAINKGITNYVFFDDASFSGYQMFDTVYSTFLNYLLDKSVNININIYILLGYASKRALNIFNLMVPEEKHLTGEVHQDIPLEHLPLKFPLNEVQRRNNLLKVNVNLKMIYAEYMKTLEELISYDYDIINTLKSMNMRTDKIPIYFCHKMPDYISVYSEIYMGFTLEPPYEMIPLINNCEIYYNDDVAKRMRNYEDIIDLSRDPPCPPPPYRIHAGKY